MIYPKRQSPKGLEKAISISSKRDALSSLLSATEMKLPQISERRANQKAVTEFLSPRNPAKHVLSLENPEDVYFIEYNYIKSKLNEKRKKKKLSVSQNGKLLDPIEPNIVKNLPEIPQKETNIIKSVDFDNQQIFSMPELKSAPKNEEKIEKKLNSSKGMNQAKAKEPQPQIPPKTQEDIPFYVKRQNELDAKKKNQKAMLELYRVGLSHQVEEKKKKLKIRREEEEKFIMKIMDGVQKEENKEKLKEHEKDKENEKERQF